MWGDSYGIIICILILRSKIEKIGFQRKTRKSQLYKSAASKRFNHSNIGNQLIYIVINSPILNSSFVYLVKKKLIIMLQVSFLCVVYSVCIALSNGIAIDPSKVCKTNLEYTFHSFAKVYLFNVSFLFFKRTHLPPMILGKCRFLFTL